jgi:rubrerythrin
MSESRFLQHAGATETEAWRQAFDEFEHRVEALRDAVLEASRAFTVDDELVERMHRRFTDVGEQWQRMRCEYPFAGVPGREDCRVEPLVSYESDAGTS